MKHPRVALPPPAAGNARWLRRMTRCALSAFALIDLSVAAEAVHLQLVQQRLATGLNSATEAAAMLASIDPHADLPWGGRELLRTRVRPEDMSHLQLVVMQEPDRIQIEAKAQIESLFVGRLIDASWLFSLRSVASLRRRQM